LSEPHPNPPLLLPVSSPDYLRHTEWQQVDHTGEADQLMQRGYGFFPSFRMTTSFQFSVMVLTFYFYLFTFNF